MGIYDRDYYQDDQLRPIRPWDSQSMVILLIIANAAFFVANFVFFSNTDQLTQWMVLRASDLLNPLLWVRFVSHGFAHANLNHILFNMLGLYFLGQNVEAKYGKWEFFRFYMICVVFCGVVWAILRGGAEDQAVLGASGAVTAVSMLFVFSFPNATLHLYGLIPVKAWLLGIGIVVLNLLGNPNSGVAYDVHLLGAGFAAVYFYGNLNFSSVSGWFAGGKRRIKQARSGLKVHRGDDGGPTTAEERESDRILEKISRDGKDSLTAKERKFMENYSEKVRRMRQS
ncbi:MAG TPA: hypothetical protein DDW52_15540 [Planctomycetaceae bacterium]|nr:hypothetical protein [Planctomycetaceae bacterium]